MKISEWQIKIVDVGYKFTRDIFIFRRLGNEIETIDGKKCNAGDEIKPALELEPEALQELADELARVGYKPQKGFEQGKLEAISEHLKDLRKLLKL